MHTHFGAGIAAKNAPILYKHGFRALTGRGHGGTQPAHAAADDHHIIVLLYRGIPGGFWNFVDKSLHRCLPSDGGVAVPGVGIRFQHDALAAQDPAQLLHIDLSW